MSALIEIPRHAVGQPQLPLAALPAATTSGSSGTSSGTASNSAATISANDFLSLLVTEMQNQDPTANTDPNEYVNQLVNVNSLEQLISINQTLSGAMGTSGSSGSSGSSGGSGTTTGGSQPVTGADSPAAAIASVTGAPSTDSLRLPGVSAAAFSAGNLSVPSSTAAADRVAQALSGLRPAR
ncbi:MAG: hypothetical protein KGL64_08605 [Acidobacteriota bacterium]|nr:hypothetical protein [Acidobacteriota bacterium]